MPGFANKQHMTLRVIDIKPASTTVDRHALHFQIGLRIRLFFQH